MNKDAKIYVAGHRGLVGSAVLRSLKNAGYKNIVVRTHRELDLTRQNEVERFFHVERPDVVLFAAARVGGILANDTFKAEFIYQNIAMATNVIHAAWKEGVTKLVNLGSSCIYPRLAPQPMREEYLLSGSLELTNEPYALAKIAAIKLCRYFNEQYGTNFISAMPTNLYGPGDNFDLAGSHVLPALLRKFHEAKYAERDDKAVELWGDGSPRREFLYVDDLADALLFLMESIDAPQMQTINPDYFVNIGTGSDVTISELASIIANIVGWDGELCWDTTKPNGTPRKLLDVSAMSELGWNAAVSLADGIGKTYRWYLDHQESVRR